MKTLIIPQKMSGTGTIHDIESEHYDRDIILAPGCKYAVVLASYYGGKGYTTHQSEETAIRQSRKVSDYSHAIIDADGNYYQDYGYALFKTGEVVR